MYKLVADISLILGVALYMGLRYVTGDLAAVPLILSFVTFYLYAVHAPFRDIVILNIFTLPGFVLYWWGQERTLAVFFLLYGVIPSIASWVANRKQRKS